MTDDARNAPNPSLPRSASRFAGCEGFLVECPGGRIGIVQEAVTLCTGGREAFLVVRAGRRGRVLFVIPESDVEHVSFERRVIALGRPHPMSASVAA